MYRNLICYSLLCYDVVKIKLEKENLSEIITSLKAKEQECQSLDDFLDLAYSFRFDDLFIVPTQIKNEIYLFLEFIQKYNPKTILEIGTSTGGTLYLLCKIAAPDATIISIDMPEGKFGGRFFPNWKIPFYESFKQPNQKIEFLRVDSHENSTLDKVKRIIGNKKLDFLLIDGDHRYEGVKNDYGMYSKLVGPEGIIAFHDINVGPENKVGQVKKFWDEIKSEKIFAEIIDFAQDAEGYGIGLLLNESKDSKKIRDFYQLQIKSLQYYRKNVELKNSIIKKNPFGVLLKIYSDRNDLQKTFPEVKESKIENLLNWAILVINGKIENEGFVAKSIIKFKDFYINELERNEKITKLNLEKLNLKTDLELEKSKEIQFRDEIEKLEKSRKITIDNFTSENEQLKMEAGKLGEDNEQLKMKLNQEKDHIIEIENELWETRENFNKILQSTGWNMILKSRRILRKYFPPNSWQRKSLDGLVFRILKNQQENTIQKKQKTIQHHVNKIEINSNYEKWKNVTDNIRSSNTNKQKSKREKISIIIPIHNGKDVIIPCIDSVLKHSTEPYEIIIVDDKSTEKKVIDYIEKIEKKPNVTLLKNSDNIGFVKSVNKGMRYSKNDAILLNSDTIVTKNWLEKISTCAYSNKKIGTVAPLSNNATICSVPEFCKPNSIPEGFTIDTFAQLIENKSKMRYPTSPTSHGFCIFIKRKILEEVGYFDEAFSPAYGEEDEFCMRIYKKGYISVIDDSTFIFHKGEASYSEKTSSLQNQHIKLLLKKHPEYMNIVNGFCKENPLHEIQSEISASVNKSKHIQKNVLTIVHRSIYEENPGGTEVICKMLFEGIRGYNKYIMYPKDSRIVVDEFTDKGIRTVFEFKRIQGSEFINLNKNEKEFFEDVLEELKIGILHVQHMLFFPINLIKIASEKNIKLAISCNDFYYICPRINLLENGKIDKFCNACEDMNRCDTCLSDLEYSKGFQKQWRDSWENLFSKIDVIITPTKAVFDLYQKTYNIHPSKNRVINHGYTPNRLIQIKKTALENIIKIAFVGSVMIPHKGKDMILDILDMNSRDNIEWHFYGNNSDPTEYIIERGIKSKGKIINHGKYDNLEIPNILNQDNIHLVILPSLETFSNVLSEVWVAKIPVIVPDKLALGERVQKTNAGWRYQYPGSAKEILEILENIISDRNAYEKILNNTKNVKVKNNFDCVQDYEDLYDKIRIGGIEK